MIYSINTILLLCLICLVIVILDGFKYPHIIYYDLKTAHYYLVIDNTYCQIHNINTIHFLGYNESYASIIDDIHDSNYSPNKNLNCPIAFNNITRHTGNCTAYRNYIVNKVNILNNNKRIVESVKSIGEYFNPSIIPFNNKILLVQRFEPRISLLDKDMNTIEEIKYNSFYPLKSTEVDIRLYKHTNGNILLTYTNEDDEPLVYTAIRELIYHQHNDSFTLTNPIKLHHDKLTMKEKNWTPFLFNDKLLFIRRIYPLQIYELPEPITYYYTKFATHKNILASEVNLIVHNKCHIYSYPSGGSWEYGEIRGGTPAVYITSFGYLAFFHSMLPYNRCGSYYYVGAYIFSPTQPFKLLKMSFQPILTKELIFDPRTAPKPKYMSIVFPTSFYMEDRNGNVIESSDDKIPDTIVLIAGSKDKFGLVIRINFNELTDSMVDICCL